MKPQSKIEPLDEADASPHPSGMDRDDQDRKGAPNPREAKLAQALRANLRRRKAADRAPEPPKTPQKPPAD